jgi:hypothetical protein
MPTLVYAVFEQPGPAEAAVTELTRHGADHPAFAVQTHQKAPLNGDDLPESATEIGRNTFIAIGFGAVGGLLLGLVAGLTLDIMGLTPLIGAMFGLITGILSGLLGGMMAGTRRPKAALREAAESLAVGSVLLTIEVTDPGHVELVEELLETRGADLVAHC